MSKKTQGTHHVLYNRKDDDWKVIRGGAERAAAVCDTKAEAIREGREISRNQNTELKIHVIDHNRISQSDSHGHDPRNIKG